MTTSEAGYARLGPLVLERDVSRRNALTILFAGFWTIGFVTFLNFMNPYVFALLGIPEEEQGSLAGLLVSLQEITQIAICGFIGAWSDRAGRRPIYVGAMVLLALGFAAYPMASSEAQLIGLRVVYAIGATACTVMMSACQGEYITDKCRGRWIGVVAIINALGVVVMIAIFSKLPVFFGQASAIVSAGVLIGQVAPEGNKGTVFGTYGVAGSAGIVTLTFAGGLLFDAYGAGSPFILMGAVNALVVVAIWLLVRWQRQTA